MARAPTTIFLKKVRVHNLKEVSLTLEGGELIAFSGVSGSGKSSLAFDTIFTEGQRRYVESLSTYARRRFGDLPKPDADAIEGISPTIAIEQKTAGRNPRSSVGTMTGIYDFLRILFARVGKAYCPVSGEPVSAQSVEQIINEVLALPKGSKILLYAPYVRGKKGEFKEEFVDLLRKGYSGSGSMGSSSTSKRGPRSTPSGSRCRPLDRPARHRRGGKNPDIEGCQTALRIGKGMLLIYDAGTEKETLFSQHAHSLKSGISYPALAPQDFSFNHPQGMCPACQGLGTKTSFPVSLIIDPEKSIAEDCCCVASSYTTVRFGNIYDNLAGIHNFSVDTPWKELSEKAKNAFLYGEKKKWTQMRFTHPTTGKSWTEYVDWKGVIAEAQRRYGEAKSEIYRNNMEALMEKGICSSCHGARIKPYPAAAQIGGKTIGEITSWPIEECLSFFKSSPLPGRASKLRSNCSKRSAPASRFSQMWASATSPRPQLPHSFGGRGAARPPRCPNRSRPCRSDLRARRTVHRPPPARQREAPRDATATPRKGKYRHRRRAR